MAWMIPAAILASAAMGAIMSSQQGVANRGASSMSGLMGKKGAQKQPIQIGDLFGQQGESQGDGANMMGQGRPSLSQILSGQAQPGYQPPSTAGINPAEAMNQETWLRRMLGGM